MRPRGGDQKGPIFLIGLFFWVPFFGFWWVIPLFGSDLVTKPPKI